MSLDTRITRSLVDAGLTVGLVLALGTVFAVDFRSLHTNANKETDRDPRVAASHKPLSHRAGMNAIADKAEMIEIDDAATLRSGAKKAAGNLASNVEPDARGSPRPTADEPAENRGANVDTPASASPRLGANVDPGRTGATPRTAPNDPPTFLGTYVNRTKKDKTQWIGRYGGSPESEACVQEGLNWLARHQAVEGFWSSECLGPKDTYPHSRCEKTGLCAMAGRNYVMAQTGLALLALQAAGNYDCNEEKYSSHVSRGLDWLVHHQQSDGALVGPLSIQRAKYGRNFMYEHAMAAFALAEACVVRRAIQKEEAPILRRAAERAIAFIEQQQHDDGGWRYSSAAAQGSDCSVSGWAMLALKSARAAAIPVNQQTIERTRDFFRSCETDDGRTAYVSGARARSNAVVAVGMLTHLLLLEDPDEPLIGTSATDLAKKTEYYRGSVQSGRAEFYTLYNATLAMYLAGGPEWDRWNNAIRDAVIAIQESGPGCQRGSWDPRGTYGGNQGGRIYSTALATLTLEVYYRFARERK